MDGWNVFDKKTKKIWHYIVRLIIDSSDIVDKRVFTVLRSVKGEIIEVGLNKVQHIYSEGYLTTGYYRQELLIVLNKGDYFLAGKEEYNELYRKMESLLVYVDKHKMKCEGFRDFLIRNQKYY